MIAYDRWEEKHVAITGLLLDALNPRIAEPHPSLTQRQLIEELVEHDKVYDLARNIAENGYFPVESLIAIEKGREKYVVEGNRRVAALKLLLSPDIAPASWQSRFKQLSDRIYVDAIKKVRVTIAPSREAAAHIIMFKHTAPQVESWAPIMRAKFYKNLIDGGQTVDAIATQYGIRASAMTDDLRMLTMYQLACSLDLPVDVLTLVRNPRTFPMTNLDRVYVVPRVSAFLGIRFGENKQPVGVVASDEFKKGYAKIVTDIATGAADSRLLNKAVDFDKYLKSFGDRTPDLSKKGNFTVESLLDSSNAADVKMRTAKLPTRKLVKKRGSVALIPKNIRCYLESRRINDIFVELRKLPVETYQNAVSVLLRSLLEMCVENYLTKSGKMKILLAEDKAAQHGKDWSPTLRQMLNYILTKDNDFNVNPLARKVISKLVSSTDSILSADSLDFFVHNRFACPTESELRSLWEKLEELFKVVLVEPNAV